MLACSWLGAGGFKPATLMSLVQQLISFNQCLILNYCRKNMHNYMTLCSNRVLYAKKQNDTELPRTIKLPKMQVQLGRLSQMCLKVVLDVIFRENSYKKLILTLLLEVWFTFLLKFNTYINFEKKFYLIFCIYSEGKQTCEKIIFNFISIIWMIWNSFQ